MALSSKPAVTNVSLSSEAEQFITRLPILWPADETVTECERCATPFTFFNRRHRCRDCFSIMCGDCTPHRVPLPYRPAGVGGLGAAGDKERVCRYCWFFIDLHQRQEVDRQSEARRMQQRAQDESLMRCMAENATGSVEQLRSHMQRELLGRNRAALEKRSTRSIAATSTRWSASDDDDGGAWAVAIVPDAAARAALMKDDDVCFRNNIVDPKRQWDNSAKKTTASGNLGALREALVAAVPKMPSPSLGLFLELSERCGVNLSLDTNSAVGQSVVASTQQPAWQRVTDDNIMDEQSIVGVAAYFRT